LWDVQCVVVIVAVEKKNVVVGDGDRVVVVTFSAISVFADGR